MAKKIIILERMRSDDLIDIKVAFWTDVPLANQVADATRKSAFAGATPAELAALRSGSVAETSKRMTWPKGTALPSIRSDLIAEHARIQTNTTAVNPKQLYGAYWDGSAWFAG